MGAFSLQNRRYSPWYLLKHFIFTYLSVSSNSWAPHRKQKLWLGGRYVTISSHTSLWSLSGSEETILVFEASELIENEILRVSCFAWKSQNLKGAPRGRVAFLSTMCSGEKKCWLLTSAESLSTVFWSSPPQRAEQRVQWAEAGIESSCPDATYKKRHLPQDSSQGSRSRKTLLSWKEWWSRKIYIPFIMKLTSWRTQRCSCTFQHLFNSQPHRSCLRNSQVPLTTLRFMVLCNTRSRHWSGTWVT